MVEWQNSGTMWSIWNLILQHARKGVRKHWPFQDRKCPHCKTWASEVGGFSTHQDSMKLEPYDYMRCKQCGRTSKWHNEGICAWTVEDTDPPTPSAPRPAQDRRAENERRTETAARDSRRWHAGLS